MLRGFHSVSDGGGSNALRGVSRGCRLDRPGWRSAVAAHRGAIRIGAGPASLLPSPALSHANDTTMAEEPLPAVARKCWCPRGHPSPRGAAAVGTVHSPRRGYGARPAAGSDGMTTQQGEGDTAHSEQNSISDRANLVARAEAAVWLALQDIGVNDRLIVLNAIMRETQAKAHEQEAAEPQTRKL